MKESLKKQFLIRFGGLKIGTHLFEYEINEDFFKAFEASEEFRKGKVKFEIEFEKQSGMLILFFKWNGNLEVVCDRCYDNFDYQISGEQKLIVKFGDKIEEITEELIVIPINEKEINVAQYIYEFIILSIPYKLVHPEDENGESMCNKEALRVLDNLLIKEEDIDPRWDILKKSFINKN